MIINPSNSPSFVGKNVLSIYVIQSIWENKKKSSYVILISITNLGKPCPGNCGSLKTKVAKFSESCSLWMHCFHLKLFSHSTFLWIDSDHILHKKQRWTCMFSLNIPTSWMHIIRLLKMLFYCSFYRLM